jgi:DNA-binding NtrC family response regulator
VWCARTAEEALGIVESRKAMPNVVVADYRLPGKLDGVEAIQRIQLEWQMAIPAIIVTGESDISAISEIEQMGYMILRKPVRPAKLRRLISHYAAKAALPASVE